MFTLDVFFEIMDKDFGKYKELLELLKLKLPDVNKYRCIYLKGDENSQNKLFQDYKEFDEELDSKICEKLKSKTFKSGCCNFLKVAHIDYNSYDMEDVLSKIVENRGTIKKAVLERTKKKQ